MKTTTITKNNEVSNFAILDCAVTKQLKFIVCVSDRENTFYHIYQDAHEMDMKCHEFVSLALSNISAKTVVTDCSIAYIPSVINVINKLSKIQIHNRRKASCIEKTMINLINNN